MKTKSRSTKFYDQEQLIELQNKAGEKLEDLIDSLGLQLSHRTRFYVGACPIHGGDNKTCFNLFHTGNELVGNWRCFTHGCQNHFHPTLLGFIRGYLSNTRYGWRDKKDSDKECPFREAVKFLSDFVGGKVEDLNIDYDLVERKRFSNHMTNIYARKDKKTLLNLNREQVVSSLKIPSEYFISRDFKESTLVKYDVGLCDTPGKPMYMRSVAPIYDENHDKVVGCTGRSIFDSCPICEAYHNPTQKCPDSKYKWVFSKWKHNKGFYAEDHLYNYWFAKEHIAKTGIAVVVESPGNVWRLEEAGIHMSIGTFGAHLTDGQRSILDKSGALSLILLTDPDAAGRLAREEIQKSCGNSYTIYTPSLGEFDVAECEIELIQNKLFPLIENIEKGYSI